MSDRKDWPRSIKAIGVIGVGGIGRSICHRLAARKYAVGVSKIAAFDPDDAALAGFSDSDVVTCKSGAHLVDMVDLVLLCLPDGADVAKVARSHEGLIDCVHQGQIIIDHGWSSLNLTRQLSTAIASRGAAFLDAPIRRSGDVDHAIAGGRLGLAIGGDPLAIDAVKTPLGSIAHSITPVGQAGAAQVVRQLGDLVAFQTFAALAEALVTARAFGIEEGNLFNALAGGQGDGADIGRPGLAAFLAVNDSPKESRISIDDAGKRLDEAIQLAHAKKLTLDGAKSTMALLEKARERGLGDGGLIGLFGVIEPGADGQRSSDVRQRQHARS
ncbi:MAG: NAD(P)-binding domain-containing protein [Pseudomonadota bacterium]